MEASRSNASVYTPSAAASSRRERGDLGGPPRLKQDKPIMETDAARAAREMRESYEFLAQLGVDGGASPWAKPVRPPPDPKEGKVLKFTTLGSIRLSTPQRQAGADVVAPARPGAIRAARSASVPGLSNEVSVHRLKTPVWAESAALRELASNGPEGAGYVNPFVARFLYRKQCGGIYRGSYFGAKKVNHGFDT